MVSFTHQDLRTRPTTSEIQMWEYLRARRMVGLKFRRQHPIGPFIVDFICLKEKVIIEMDGIIHEDKKEYDQKRDQWLRGQGFTVIRIRNEEFEEKREQTVLKIRKFFLRRLGF